MPTSGLEGSGDPNLCAPNTFMKGYIAKEEKADSTLLAVSSAEIEREFCTFRPSSFLSVIAKKLPERSPKCRGAGAMQTSRTSIESALTRARTS
jgi:hypothetical protein